MTFVVGCWVADSPGENCHTFVYNWMASKGIRGLRALGRGNALDPGQAYSMIYGSHALQSARIGGVIQVGRGDVIGFFDMVGTLQHSMLARSKNQWWGTRNINCMGSGLGRHRFDVADNDPRWNGNGNLWNYATGGTVRVLFYHPH